MAEPARAAQETGIARLEAAVARSRVPLGFVCAAGVLWLSQPTLATLAGGGVIAVFGEAVRIWAAGHLEKGREVTQSGPYRMTRHPLYVGSAIIAAGAAVASARVSVALIIAAYMGITIVSAIRHEEASMRSAFGDAYDAYARSGSTLPVTRAFSLGRAIKNKEHKAVAGLVIFAAILALKAAL